MNEPVDNEVFEKMFRDSDDPWAFRTRWYEERKRQLTLASLPSRRYACGYEPGCANGELSAALATRCDRLLASDSAVRAVELSRQRLAGLPNVEVLRLATPVEWPNEPLDLVVVSELGYYLSEGTLRMLCQRAKDSVGDAGTVLACHWRAPIAGCALNGDDVHRVLHASLGMHRIAHHFERDFVLDVWCGGERSVFEREAFA